MRPDRRLRLLAALVAAVCVLGGCSASTSADAPSTVGALSVGSAPQTGFRIAAHIYAEVLRHAGASVSGDLRVRDEDGLLEGVASGDLDLFPTFTGSALRHLTAADADASPAPTSPSAAPSGADDEVDQRYVDLNKALPQGVSVGDATPVRDDTGQYLVPVYRSAALDRAEVRAVNRVAGELTTADLDAMIDQVDRHRAGVDGVVATWLGEHNL